MTDRFAVVHTQVDTGTAPFTQDITSADMQGENLQWAILIIHGSTSDGSTQNEGRISVVIISSSDGVKANARNRCVASRARNGVASTGALSAASSGIGFIPSATASASVGRCVFDARISNGLRIEWTETPDANYRMTVLMGGGHANVFASNDIAPTASGNNTDPGFEPDLLIVRSLIGTFSNPFTFNNDVDPGLGFCINDGNETQASIYGEWNSPGSPTDADTAVSSDSCGGGAQAGVERSWSVSAFISTGYTRQAVGVAINYEYLAIKLTDPTIALGIAIEDLPSSAVPTAFTGLGFSPRLALYTANLQTAVDTFQDGAGGSTFAIGAFSRTAEGCGSMSQQEGVTLGGGTNTNTDSRAAAKAFTLLDHTGATAAEATLQSIDPMGFTWAFSTATAGKLVVLGIGDRRGAPLTRGRHIAATPPPQTPPGLHALAGRAARMAVPNLWRSLWLNLQKILHRPTPPVREKTALTFPPPLEGEEREGWNAIAGSERGSNAVAGSEEGWNP